MKADVKRILVPVDFSENAKLAKDFALAQAERFGAEVELLHVVDDSTYTSYMQRGLVGDMHPYLPGGHVPDESNMDDHGHEFMAKARKELESYCNNGGECKISLRHGNVVEEILKEVDNYHADMIVMCTHGWTGLKHLMMGSVTERVVRLSKVPVLTTRGLEHA